jgi:hypothetical protein
MNHCGIYSFQEGHSLPVVDREGWNMLWTVLVDYLGESDFSCPDEVTNDRFRLSALHGRL